MEPQKVIPPEKIRLLCHEFFTSESELWHQENPDKYKLIYALAEARDTLERIKHIYAVYKLNNSFSYRNRDMIIPQILGITQPTEGVK